MSIRRLLTGASFVIPLCITTALHAQVRPTPPPREPKPDTAAARPVVPARSAEAERDSLLRVDSIRVADAVRDSARRTFPAMTTGGPAGFAAGVWEWDREAILREGAITVGDLLRRIPGMQSLRSGGYVQPEAVTAFGQTRGRIQFELDGYVLDPLQESTYDVAHVELINITALRVERRLDVTRVIIATATPVTGTPYTRIEAATGEPDMNAFRAVFLVPYVIVGPLGIGLDRLDTDGLDGRESASALTGWAKWSWTNGRRGVQLEYRRQNLDREIESPWPTERTRSDVILRARSQLMPGLTAELYGGSSRLAVEPPDSTGSDDIPEAEREQALERSTWQAGARAVYAYGPASIGGALRMRTNEALPAQEAELNASVGIASLLQLGGSMSYQAWSDGPSATTYNLRAEAGVGGFSAFGEYARGYRGAPLYRDSSGISTLESHSFTRRAAMRVGAAVNRFGVTGGAAYVVMEGPYNESFGLPFDSVFASLGGSTAEKRNGVEAWGRVGLFRNRIALDGSYTFWNEAEDWLYLPGRSWRVAAEVDLSPLESGNLGIFGRVESVRRGPMLAVDAVTAAGPGLTILPPNHLLNGYLQIRIIDVRAFIQWEDMLNKGRLDVPGRLISGPRFFYGVKWELLN